MRKALCLLLNLHRGEEKRAILFLLLALSWGIGCSGSLALGDGLFLEEISADKLPLLYLASSFVLCTISGLILYNLSKNRLSPKLLLLLSVTGIVINNLYLLQNVSENSPFPKLPLFLYRILSWGFLVLCTSNFWSFADLFFNLQDAKRHFGIFHAVIFLSDCIGSQIVNYIETLGIRVIILAFVCVLLLAYPLVFYISRSLKDLSNDHELFIGTESVPLSKTFKVYLKDKYTFYLLCTYFLLHLLAIATEFNYLKVFEASFANASPLKLTRYMAQCASWISIGGMFFTLFAYSRIIKRIGVNNIILFVPLCFISLFFCWSFKASLTIATIGMVAREGLSYAFDDSNLQLLINGVPNKIRNQIRIAIESFIEPVGMFIWAIVCFFVSYQYTLCLMIALVAGVLVCLLRSCYANAILRNLSTDAVHLSNYSSENVVKNMSVQEKRQLERFLLAQLKHLQERDQIFIFQYLLNLGNRNVLPSVLAHMNKLGVFGKLKAIDMLKNSIWAKDFLTLEMLKRWLYITPHQSISAAVHLYFAKHDILCLSDISEDLYSAPVNNKLLAAILTTRKQLLGEPYQSLANTRLQSLLTSTNPEYICMGLNVLALEKKASNFEFLMSFLEKKDERIFLHTCKALYASVDLSHKNYGRQLIQALQNNTHNQEACLYLIKTINTLLDSSLIKEFLTAISYLKTRLRIYAETIMTDLTQDSAEMFLTLLLDETIHNRCRLLAAKILRKNHNRLLKKHAYKLFKVKVVKALFYDYHKNYTQQQYPQYNLNLLTDALESSYQSEVNFMLELLCILSSVEHCDLLTRALMGKNLKAKAQALESLEKNCDNSLLPLIEPFINNSPKPREKYYIKSGVYPLTLKELLSFLEQTPSYLCKLVCKQLREELAYFDSDFAITLTHTNEEISLYPLPASLFQENRVALKI